MDETKSSFFARVGAKASFYMGLGSGIGGIFVIGFFLLVGMYFKGGTFAFAGNNPSLAGNQVADTGQPGAPAPISFEMQKNEWVRGDKNAKVAMVTFSDTECPFCKRFHSTMQQVMNDYNGKVKWVYRNFPLAQLHQYATKEAEALECAGDLGGNDVFWKYLDRMMELTQSNDGLPPQQLPEIATFVGLNKAKFESCLSSGKFAKKVQDNIQAAVAAGGTGTPYNLVIAGDQKIPVNGAVPIEQLKAILDPLVK